MQTPNYQRNANKAAQMERLHDYPMAAVFWSNAANSKCTHQQKHWAECRSEHCKKMIGDDDA